MRPPFRLNAVAAMLACLSHGASAADTPAPPAVQIAGVVVVSASRIEHDSFDLPASVDVVDSARIREGQLRVNVSEALAAVPGLVAQDRQNYAQDLQISSRGFGARSAFGVRGVRLISDGVPATMPDGQGQPSAFNLDVAERIEVLRGPFSAIYGNHAGGVIQLFTRDGRGAPTIEATVAAGSDGARKSDINASGAAGALGYVLDVSRFSTDGYRDHSAATRDQAFAKLTMTPTAGGKLTLVANALRQDGTQDPLGASWSTYQRDPRAGEIDLTDTQNPKRTLAQRYDTRKDIDHQQAGLAWDQRFGDDALHLMVYGGNRKVVQYQAFSKGLQAAPTQSGGVVDFDRDFYGADIRYTKVAHLGDATVSTTAGIEYGHSRDGRTGYENFIGAQYGVRGALRRDEADVLSSVDPYLQAEWRQGPWILTGGLRHSHLDVTVRDAYLANGDDSGAVSYSHTTPVLAALYKISPVLNVYASAARGFETPTLNELFYSGAAGGFNFGLRAARSTHVEAGVKAIVGADARINAALFQVRTSDELVVDASSGGRTSYRNASKTLRQGGELSLDAKLGGGLSSHVALTVLRAIYDQGFGTVRAGSRLPGVPNANAFADLSWQDSSEHFGAALEAVASSKTYADDANADIPAPGYAVLNGRLNARQEAGHWRFKEFVRVNNLLDRRYVGSLIVGDANKRYYEAAPGRNWMAGVSAAYAF